MKSLFDIMIFNSRTEILTAIAYWFKHNVFVPCDNTW
jgi:hypothetical protein